ncbi:TOG array regulator of axonemal microtubules protein 1, partial [Gastrophryne carolinensis]
RDWLGDDLRWGLIPPELQSRLLDPTDYKSRTRAIEELKRLVRERDFGAAPRQDMLGLIGFLCALLDDGNFTVVLVTLDVLNSLVANLGGGVRDYLRPLVASTVKLLGDGKATVKQEYMKIYMGLMKGAGPSRVLSALLQNLGHKNSRVREEVVNVCIAALLTYPSEDFDLPLLASEIAPCLVDGKRRVRHAALEAFAVLAASIGPGKGALLKAVDKAELQENGEGVMNAVQARLARKTLPRISPQGLVEYALPFPSSAGQVRGAHHLPGADTDWLLTGGGGVRNGDHRSVVTLTDPVARRMLSAGKGKNKFPWEEAEPGDLESVRGGHSSDQLSASFDAHHTPIVRTPTAKVRNSSAKQLPTSLAALSEPLATFSSKDDAPVPLKASMVRLPSGPKDFNRSKPVPPIAKSTKSLPEISSISGSYVWDNAKASEKSYEEERITIDLLELTTRDDDDREEMISSLRHLRNSAAKKRAKMSGSLSDLDSPDSMKIDLNMDSPSSTSSPINGSYSESGVYSRESMSSPLSPTPQLKKMSDVAPKPKPRPIRVLSAPRNKEAAKKAPESLQQGNLANEKPVSVIGQRLNYRNGTTDAEDSFKEAPPLLTRPPHKPSRPIKGITGSVTSFQQVNNERDAPSPLAEDSVAVIGKGVFESLLPSCQSYSQSSLPAPEDAGPLKPSVKPPTGVYGRALPHSTAPAESDAKVSISKSARDKMRQKKENGLKDLERGARLSYTDPGPLHRESWRSPSDVEGADLGPALKRTSSLKKSSAQRSPHHDRLSLSRSSDIADPSAAAVPRELPRPDLSVAEAFKLMADDDWEKKMEGLNLARSLAVFHCDIIMERLHDLKIAVTQEVKNLRSTVSRAAIGCLGDMFTHLKRNMDHELDPCVRALLHKAGESNIFIREDADKALEAMVQSVTPGRALAALLNGGLSHLNNSVRKCAAQHMCDLLERMGPGRILSGIKDVTDRALPAVAKFAQDGSQETRFYGRKMLHYLMSHPDFDRMLEKYLPSKDLPYLRDLIKQIQVKGVGEIQDAPSARGRRSYHGSVGSLRASSVSQNAHNTFERDMKSVNN